MLQRQVSVVLLAVTFVLTGVDTLQALVWYRVDTRREGSLEWKKDIAYYDYANMKPSARELAEERARQELAGGDGQHERAGHSRDRAEQTSTDEVGRKNGQRTKHRGKNSSTDINNVG